MKLGRKKREKEKHLTVKTQPSRSSSVVSTAYHEAGHAVMAYFEDIRNKGTSIKPEGDTTGICRLKNILLNINPKKDGSLRMRDKIERLARVKLAGPIAQRWFSTAQYRQFHGQEDRRGAIDLLSSLTDSKEELEAYLNLLHIQVPTKIISPVVRKAIKTVANHLLQSTSLNGCELKEVIGQSIHQT